MRFTCPSCGSGYRIDQDRVPEEGARLNCGSCSARMVVRREGDVALAPSSSAILDEADDTLSDDLTASFTRIDLHELETEQQTEEVLVWHITDSAGETLTLTEAELGEGLVSGRLDAETRVWRPGLEAWTPLHKDPLAAEIVKRSGPWQSGSITSIFSAAQVDRPRGDRAEVLPEQAPAALDRLVGRPTLPPSALPSDISQDFDDRLGEQPEVVLSNEGLLRRGGAGSPVTVAVRRNQRRLLFMALGIPLMIVLVWRVVTWPRAGQTVVSEQREGSRSKSSGKGGAQQEQERQRRQRLLLRKGSFRLTSDQKAEVLQKEIGPLRACGLTQKGDALVRFRIKPNGAPFDIRVAGVSGTSATCVRQTIARWRFPRFTGPADEMSFPLPSD